MANKLFITATEAHSGASLVAKGVMAQLARDGRKVAFFKPIICTAEKSGEKDPDICVMLSQFGLQQSPKDSYALTCKEARALVTNGKTDVLLDTVLKKFSILAKQYDFVLCLGVNQGTQNGIFAFDLNTLIADNIGAPVLMVTDAIGKETQEIIDSTLLTRELMREKGLGVLACVVNRPDNAAAATIRKGLEDAGLKAFVLPDGADFSSHAEGAEVARAVDAYECSSISPKMFEFNLMERAKSQKMRIVLPEGEEERILRAAELLEQHEVADIILLGNKQAIQDKIKTLGLKFTANIIQPDASPEFADYIDTYAELRKAKNITREMAQKTMMDNTYYGTMMVHKGHADGMVSGAINTTAHTIRPAFEFIKTKPGTSIVSSVFLMCLKDRVLAFGDCAVNPNPTPEQLAGIAISSAQTAKVFGIDPRVAMLSYSTGTSGKGPDVDMVIEAVKIAHEKAPDLILDGPIQYDAAIAPEVGKTKLPGSKVAGQATVFIFPDLNTGNNTYKAVQRAANAIAIGPVLQGLNKPVNDLSRGCTVPDIVNTVAITAIQAQAEKNK